VAVDVKFAAASRDWSCQMARTNDFAHDPNFAAGGALAEIIAARSGADGDVGAQLHQQFLDSSAHREILLNPAYTQVGSGVCVLNGYWVTERFGTSTAVAAHPHAHDLPVHGPVHAHDQSVHGAVHAHDHLAGPAHATPCRPGPPPGAELRPGAVGRLGRDRRQASRIPALPFTGTSITLPVLLLGLALVVGGASMAPSASRSPSMHPWPPPVLFIEWCGHDGAGCALLVSRAPRPDRARRQA
jgi:hypothetical protein